MSRTVVTPLTQALSEGKLTRQELRSLMTRSDGLALRRLIPWSAMMGASAALVWWAMGSVWMVPAMFVHGVILVHHFSLQHECVHYTVFRTRWLNDLVGNYCGLVIMLPNKFFRYEHCDHHTYTQIEGRDPELLPLPRSFWDYANYVSGIPYWRNKIAEIFGHVRGELTAAEQKFVPGVEHRSLFREARWMVSVYGVVVLAMFYWTWWAPLWFWFLPVLLGEPVMRFIRVTEHVGRPMVADMRVNTRTSLISPVWRFLCWNMNFHAEHHYAPSVPFHALPALHEKLKNHVFVEPRGYLGAHGDILAQVFGRKPRADAPMVMD